MGFLFQVSLAMRDGITLNSTLRAGIITDRSAQQPSPRCSGFRCHCFPIPWFDTYVG